MSKVHLGDVAKERKETCKDSKNGYPIVGLEHLTPEEITLSAWEEDKENSFSKLFHKGDVLFGRRRAYLKKAVVAPFDGICSGDITVIEAIPEKILPELLPFIIQNDALFNYATNKSAGSLSPRVKWEHLKNYEFELPDMKKQRELAKVLWAMDATKKSYQKLLQKTDELVKSRFVEMFHDCHREKLGDICQIKARIGWQGLKKNEYLSSGDYLLVTGVDFVKNRIDFEHCFYVDKERYEQDEYIQLQAGDVLITKDGTIGKVAFVEEIPMPATLNSGVFVVRDLYGKVSNWFLYYAFMTKEFETFVEGCKTGSTIAHLNQGAFINYEIPVPNTAMQEEFVLFARQSDKSKFELEQALAELTTTYKKIISENLG
ncbi:MAG: hypothetical protein APF84_02510 [Gracilibacter sp. BRH_c7a]|nr:MAG: hypothetical protein APF84_02510 [Gracilibacter sp. BRH_c7a]